MRFPFRDDMPSGVLLNFEFMEQSGIYWGFGVPSFVPSENQSGQKLACFYFNRDPNATAGHRVYWWSGSAWTGVV